jgi:MFS family permease
MMTTEINCRVTYWHMLKNRRVCLAVVSALVGMIFMFYFDSIVSEHLEKDMHFNPDYNGFFFALLCLSYGVSAFFVNWLSKKLKRRYLTLCSFLLTSLALFCFGPSPLLRFPQHSLTLTLVGLSLLGLSSACIFVPLMSELIEAIKVQDIIGESPALADKASGIFNAAYSLGCIIAPIIGAALNQKMKFARTCDVMAMSALGHASIYCVVGVILPKVMGEKPTLIDINSTRHKNYQHMTPDAFGQPS